MRLVDEAISEIVVEGAKEGDPVFRVDSDSRAEWSLLRIREEKAELERMKILCENMIQHYQDKIEKAERDYESNTAYFRSQLQQYFETVPRKATKTQEIYKLPSGTLKKKYGGVEYVRDNDSLVRWLKEAGKTELVKVKEEANWSELKKQIKQVEDKAVTDDGEIVEGVTLVTKEDKFEIELA
jgi:hypothetical protein